MHALSQIGLGGDPVKGMLMLLAAVICALAMVAGVVLLIVGVIAVGRDRRVLLSISTICLVVAASGIVRLWPMCLWLWRSL
jgi:hypothetical protein